MSFKPIVQILQVPRTSSSFYFKDATGTYPTEQTGWGAPNGPSSITDITSVWGAVQGYGREPHKATSAAGNLQTKAELTVYIPDGVNNFIVYYGQVVSYSWTLSLDRKTITFTDPNIGDVLDGVGLISPAGEFPVQIKSRTGGTVVLYEPLPGETNSGTSFFRYYSNTQRRLVQNCLEGKITNAIALLPLDKKKCESSQGTLDLVLLKLSAETAYNCGNFTRAQEASELGCYDAVKGDSNCTSCG